MSSESKASCAGFPTNRGSTFFTKLPTSLPDCFVAAVHYVIVKAFYPLLLGVSSHDGTLIRTQFGIHFHLIEMSETLGDIFAIMTLNPYALQLPFD